MPTFRPRPMAGSLIVRGSVVLGMAAAAFSVWVGGLARPRELIPRANAAGPLRPGREIDDFELLRKAYQDLSYEGLVKGLGPPRSQLTKLSFDPTRAKYFDLVRERLGLTDREVAMLREQGLVAVDPGAPLTFGTAYHQLYVRDLPVLVTTDSILHAVHRSYDRILMEVEATWFAPAIDELLTACHAALAREVLGSAPPEEARDVDLYLTVARNLLAGAGAPLRASSSERPDPRDRTGRDDWSGWLLVNSAFRQDKQALEILYNVRALVLQTPPGPMTEIYGGRRCVDYSQFRPRGHYDDSSELRRYFRCLMWLGRADCAWYVLPTRPSDALQVDIDRELRAAVRLARLLESTGQIESLRALDAALAFLVGRGDDLSPSALLGVLRAGEFRSTEAGDLVRLKDALHSRDLARPMIRSQVLTTPSDPSAQAEAPAAFQVLGQRFVLDSFLLSRFVHDAIDYRGQKMQRYMPQGLDVMAALGNDEALALLEGEIRRWGYAANLMAARDFLARRSAGAWSEAVSDLWLDTLRTLDDGPAAGASVPEAMQTRAWQRKQLQAQLGSWAELRHDTVLYAKQSYSVLGCEYPSGYVEPYPQFFAKVRRLAEEAGRRLAAVRPPSRDPARAQAFLQQNQARLDFFANMARTARRLETMARKELDGQPFSAEEVAFLKKTIDRRGTGSGRPRFDGWYSKLFYSPFDHDQWRATVADVHTDPNSAEALQAATGNTGLLVVAVDSQGDRAVYVGPSYSYYEFRRPVESRLTDAEWMALVRRHELPDAPEWTRSFRAPPREGGHGLPAYQPASEPPRSDGLGPIPGARPAVRLP